MNIQPTISVKAYAQIKYPFDYPLRPKATARKVQRKCASGEIPAEKDGGTKIRHGGLHLVRAAYRGTLTLPDPSNRNWRDILGNASTLAEAKRFHKNKMSTAHPDRESGSHEMAAELNIALEQAVREFKSGD